MEVIFHMTPNGNPKQRSWDKFPVLAEYLVDAYDATIVVVGSVRDTDYVNAFLEETRRIHANTVNLCGNTNLDELKRVLQTCSLLVCVNSFVMHLGVALGVPLFAIVGATEPKVVLPPGMPCAFSLYASDISLETIIEGIKTIIGIPSGFLGENR